MFIIIFDMFSSLHTPRIYPLGFGHGLRDVMSSWRCEPRLRQKKTIDTKKSDRELFEELSLDDVWEDAKLVDIYFYLRASKKTQIPDSWVQVFEALDAQLASYRDASHS